MPDISITLTPGVGGYNTTHELTFISRVIREVDGAIVDGISIPVTCKSGVPRTVVLTAGQWVVAGLHQGGNPIDRVSFTVGDTDETLWDLIEASLALPDDTPLEQLLEAAAAAAAAAATNTAVAGYIGTAGAARTAVDSRVETVGDERYAATTATPVSVLDFGADPTAGSDSSEAFAAAVATGRPVYVPAGAYWFNGDPLTGENLSITGAGNQLTTIGIGAGKWFVDDDQAWDTFRLSGIRFNAGAGIVRNTHSSGNVTGQHVVSDCAFIGYTGCAVSTDSTDWPYWKIERNIFQGSATSIGVALSGLTDGTSIVDNAFTTNRVHVKLRAGGNNAYLDRNDFLRFLPYVDTPRIDVWVVPNPSWANAGPGLVISRGKFGNENLNANDLRIVYADEGSGAYNGARMPVLDTASTGYITGHSVRDVLASGIGDTGVAIPLVFSTTPNVVGCQFGPYTLAGATGYPVIRYLDGSLGAAPASNVIRKPAGPSTPLAADRPRRPISASYRPLGGVSSDLTLTVDTYATLGSAGTWLDWSTWNASTAKFRVCSGVLATYPSTSHGYNAINGLTVDNGAGLNSFEIECWTNATDFRVHYVTSGNHDAWVLVDDRPISAQNWIHQAVTNGNATIRLTQGSAVWRKIRVGLANTRFIAVSTNSGAGITKTQPGFRLALVAASYGQGVTTTANAVSSGLSGHIQASNAIGHLVQHTGIDVYRMAYVGSGYLAGNVIGADAYYGSSTRMAALDALPDVDAIAIWSTGGNDLAGANTPTATVAEAQKVWTAIRGIRPEPLVVIGPFRTLGTDGSNYDELNTRMKAAALAHPAVADYVDLRADSPFTGTGYDGATTGVGNTDLMICGDGIHPTHVGAQVYGRYLARKIGEAMIPT